MQVHQKENWSQSLRFSMGIDEFLCFLSSQACMPSQGGSVSCCQLFMITCSTGQEYGVGSKFEIKRGKR